MLPRLHVRGSRLKGSCPTVEGLRELLGYIGVHFSIVLMANWTRNDRRKVETWALYKVRKSLGKVPKTPQVIVRGLIINPEALLPMLPPQPEYRETVVVWSLNQAQSVGKPVQKAEMYVSPMRRRNAS